MFIFKLLIENINDILEHIGNFWGISRPVEDNGELLNDRGYYFSLPFPFLKLIIYNFIVNK
jgi:hypothetical protein